MGGPRPLRRGRPIRRTSAEVSPGELLRLFHAARHVREKRERSRMFQAALVESEKSTGERSPRHPPLPTKARQRLGSKEADLFDGEPLVRFRVQRKLHVVEKLLDGFRRRERLQSPDDQHARHLVVPEFRIPEPRRDAFELVQQLHALLLAAGPLVEVERHELGVVPGRRPSIEPAPERGERCPVRLGSGNLPQPVLLSPLVLHRSIDEGLGEVAKRPHGRLVVALRLSTIDPLQEVRRHHLFRALEHPPHELRQVEHRGLRVPLQALGGVVKSREVLAASRVNALVVDGVKLDLLLLVPRHRELSLSSSSSEKRWRTSASLTDTLGGMPFG